MGFVLIGSLIGLLVGLCLREVGIRLADGNRIFLACLFQLGAGLLHLIQSGLLSRCLGLYLLLCPHITVHLGLVGH